MNEMGPLRAMCVLSKLLTVYKFYKAETIVLFFVFGVIKILNIQSKLFITSLIITEYSISDINMLGTDLFPLKFSLYNRIFT